MTRVTSSSAWGGKNPQDLVPKNGKFKPVWPGTCLCTKAGDNEKFIKLHLEKESYVDTIKILNRAKCCPDRLEGYEVWVGKSRCGTLYMADQDDKGWIEVHCPWSAMGSDVTVKMPSGNKGGPELAKDKINDYLTICGYQIIGE